MNQILFLCTGNYYRSRFAEILFNTLADRGKLAWRASSRGLRLDDGSHNVGPISPHAVRGLSERKIHVGPPIRFPLAVSEADLCRAMRVVALKEKEHRPLLARQFPGWDAKVEYWHIDDLDCARPEDALAALEREVVAAIGRLGLAWAAGPIDLAPTNGVCYHPRGS